jgi:hypothetical protein
MHMVWSTHMAGEMAMDRGRWRTWRAAHKAVHKHEEKKEVHQELNRYGEI